MVSFTHEQNSICSQKQLNDIAHEHTIIFFLFFFRPMKRKKHLHRMIICTVSHAILIFLMGCFSHLSCSQHGTCMIVEINVVTEKSKVYINFDLLTGEK